MTRELPWKVVWITGASTGIGRQLALKLAAGGVKVAASARSAEKLASMGGGVSPYALDVTDDKAVAETVARIEAELGAIDLAVLAAGIYRPQAAADFNAADVRAALETNVMGVVHGLAALLPAMRKRRAGHVSFIASVAGYRGLPKASAYGASKAALINMAESLQPELAQGGVSLSVINPGFVETPMTAQNDFPMPFLMTADEAAERIIAGLVRRKFEIAFPRRFVTILKLARILPYTVYFWLMRRFVLPRS